MATLSAYTKLDRVGRGSYGEVFKVRRHSDGAELVLKQVSMLGISEQEEREILNETSCMMQLSHPHIIAFVGSFLEQGSLHIVMEFASGGDLQCLIRRHTQTGTFLSEDRLWKFLIQLTQGLQHAHSRRILHRDIKASNVFIDANDNIKIGDLGLGKILGAARMHVEHFSMMELFRVHLGCKNRGLARLIPEFCCCAAGEARCALSQVGTPIYMRSLSLEHARSLSPIFIHPSPHSSRFTFTLPLVLFLCKAASTTITRPL